MAKPSSASVGSRSWLPRFSYSGLIPDDTHSSSNSNSNSASNSGGGDTSGGQSKPDKQIPVWPPQQTDAPAASELKILQFALDTRRVTPGQKAHLVWNVQGASAVTISPAIGTVDAQGSREITVDRTTQFVISATKLTGEEVHQTVASIAAGKDTVIDAATRWITSTSR